MPNDMVPSIGKITVRSIERFLSRLEKAALIENPRGRKNQARNQRYFHVPDKGIGWCKRAEGMVGH